MAKSSRQSGVQRLLDLCDELRALRKKIQDPGLELDKAQRLRRRSRGMRERIATDLRGTRFRGELRELVKGLEPEAFLVLTILLRKYLRSNNPWLEGRALLSGVFDSSFEMLRGIELLQPDAPLRAEQLVQVEPAEPEEEDGGEAREDLLESRFRLAPPVIEAFLAEIGSKSSPGARKRRPYGSFAAYLVDLKLLHNLHRNRALRLFGPERWWRAGGPAEDRGVRALTRRIRSLREHIQKRLEVTEHAEDFPALRFAREMDLDFEEFLIVAHLVFLELHEGNPYSDAVFLMGLVSGSEEEFLRMRRRFQPKATLLRREILEIETMLDERELTSECRLQAWVLDRFLGPAPGDQPIGADERLDFHLFLEKLEGSKFLKDL
jgi:hypothetical protein